MQFSKSVAFLLNKIAKEKDDAMLWEFFLHKVNDKSFAEWKKELKAEAGQGDVMLEAKKEEIIQKSQEILEGFKPRL